MPHTWTKDEFTLSTDPALLDLDVIHGFLATCYWTPGIPRELVARQVANSLSFGLFHAGTQIGFARLVTDMASFAYLADVFVLPEFRGRGLARWMTALMLDHPELQTVRRWLLSTADAHGVYAEVGFGPLPEPGRYMTIKRPQPWAP
ncbi:MAG: family acetyltransferase [Cyanobacteria bacterium RYN_339]|nr:family acetyltransferase [Cyanobacteria bacterium RYN_339]